MGELKTKKTSASVTEFLAAIEDDGRRADCKRVAKMMKDVSKSQARMWGPSIVGFGDRTYQGASGVSDWFVMGFASRKQDLTLYLMGGVSQSADLLKKLGRHKTGKGCLYLKRLDDVDLEVLEQMMRRATKPPKA